MVTTMLNITLGFESDGKESKTHIKYKGKCTPAFFDRALLQMVTTMMNLRDDELKKRGLTDKSILYQSDKLDDANFSEYMKP